MKNNHRLRRVATAALAASLLVGGLAACSSSGTTANAGAEGASADDIAKALDTETTLTVWGGWAPQLEPIVEAFEAKYPQGPGQPGERGNRQCPLHQAAERR